MPEFTELLISQSFPIAVAVYLLVRMETRIQQLDDTIASLQATIHVLCYKKDLENDSR